MDFSKTQNIFYNVLAILLISWIVSYGDLFLFSTFVVISHSHYLLSYIWTVKFDLQKIILLLVTALFLFALYLSPISTEAIILIVSLAFLFHFWIDEIRMNPASKYQSWQEAHYFVVLIFVAVLALFEYLRPQFKLLNPYMMLIPTTMIYQCIVIFHGLRWLFYTNQKWSQSGRFMYAMYILSLVVVHLFFVLLLKNIDLRSSLYNNLVAPRALYCWGLVHILFTYLNRRKYFYQTRI